MTWMPERFYNATGTNPDSPTTATRKPCDHPGLLWASGVPFAECRDCGARIDRVPGSEPSCEHKRLDTKGLNWIGTCRDCGAVVPIRHIRASTRDELGRALKIPVVGRSPMASISPDDPFVAGSGPPCTCDEHARPHFHYRGYDRLPNRDAATARPDRAAQIRAACSAIADMILERDAVSRFGPHAPARIFSRLSDVETLCERVDSNLTLIANTSLAEAGDETLSKLIGYLVLLRIALAESGHEFTPNSRPLSTDPRP